MGVMKEGLTTKQHKRTFWGGGNVLFLDYGGGYALCMVKSQNCILKKSFY